MSRLNAALLPAAAMLAAAALALPLWRCGHAPAQRLPAGALKDGLYRLPAGAELGSQCRNPLYRTKIRLDAEGFRGPASPAASVGFFGDSYVFGTCLRDEETLPAQLARELAARGAPAAVANFGVPGYNLRSSLRLAAQLAPGRLETALVYLFPEDDLLDCDITCQQELKRRDPAAYARFAARAARYLEEQHRDYRAAVRRNLGAVLDEALPAGGQPGRPRLVFVLAGGEREPFIEETFRARGLEFVQLDHAACRAEPRRCRVPLDGHPSPYFNALAAAQLADYLAAGRR